MRSPGAPTTSLYSASAHAQCLFAEYLTVLPRFKVRQEGRGPSKGYTRFLPHVTFHATLPGAIHKVTITGTLL